MTTFPPPRQLTVVTDERCELCRRCRGWLADQALLVEVEFLPVGSDEAVRRYGSLGTRRDVLIVADEHGWIWAGADAFVMCLWATSAHRNRAHLAARPGWRTVARVVFGSVSSNRGRIAELMAGRCDDGSCDIHGHPQVVSPGGQRP